MQFYVEGYYDCHGIPEQEMDIYPHVKLVTDDFDDFGNQTLFRMYYKKKQKGSYQFIGKVKILHKTKCVVREAIDYNFTSLGKEFCSLGQSTEYYRTMKGLNTSESEFGQDILVALNDIAINKDIKERFKDQDGIRNSLMRESEAFHAYKMGHNIFFGISSHIEGKVAFTYTYDKEFDKKVYFEFNDKNDLPNRINVIVGKNGTGKTKILSSLASILSGFSEEGKMHYVDERPEFSRYIAVSYSAFDNFEKTFKKKYSKKAIVQEKMYIIEQLKKQRDKSKRKAEKDKDFNILYKYFEHIVDEIEKFEYAEGFSKYFGELLQGNEYEENAISDNQIGSYVYCGLVRENRIIAEEEMFQAFKKNLSEITRMGRVKEWKSIMTKIFDGNSDLKRIFENNKIVADELVDENFYLLSSGQKIMLHIFTQVIMSITEDSLLLIDEPEIHLHPNAISNFMRMLNKLLEKFNSFAIISTHSPIVLQEIPSRYVRVFDNNEFYDTELWDECFGENISKIIANVFNVRPDESNYKSFFLDKKEEGFTKEAVEELFDDNLSMNAELYLNLLYKGEE